MPLPFLIHNHNPPQLPHQILPQINHLRLNQFLLPLQRHKRIQILQNQPRLRNRVLQPLYLTNLMLGEDISDITLKDGCPVWVGGDGR